MRQEEVKGVFVCLHKRCILVVIVSNLAHFICVENDFVSLSDVNEMKVEMSWFFSAITEVKLLSELSEMFSRRIWLLFFVVVCVVSISWRAVSQLLRWKVWMLYVYFLGKKNVKKSEEPSNSSHFYNTIVTDPNKQFEVSENPGCAGILHWFSTREISIGTYAERQSWRVESSVHLTCLKWR